MMTADADERAYEPSSTDTPHSKVHSLGLQKFEENLSTFTSNCRNNHKFDFIDLLSAHTRSNMCVLGVDEAGRGPVLGPMVYACAIAPLGQSKELKTLGLADSKTLTESRREQLLEEMFQRGDWISAAVHVISPVYITEKMLDRSKTSLNVISHEAAIGLIQTALDKGVNLAEVYVDTVGKAEHYEAKLQSLFPSLKIRVESKADDTYPIVSAASIFAKVTRDRLLALWPMEERGQITGEIGLGSGYPGDPVTKKYLRTCLDPVFGFPSIVRAAWSTATNLMDSHGVPVLWEDDDAAEKLIAAKKLARKRASAKGICELSNYFNLTAKPNSIDVRKRQPYFVQTKLVHVQNIG